MGDYFSDCDIEVVDIQPLMRRQYLASLINLFWVLWLYGKEIVRGRKCLWACFWRTPFMHRKIRALVQKRFGNRDWLFTFQIQSLYDASIPGVPHFVYTDHTHLANLDYPSFHEGDLYHRKWVESEREIYANAATTFVWSSNMIDVLVNRYGIDPEKTMCVYAGPNIEVPQTAEQASTEFGRRILFVGVDWERKGGPDMLAAFERVRASVPEASLTIVSRFCPDRSEWPHGVRFTGRIPLPAVADEFSRADVFCLPTHLEPFGIVFIEAMAYAMPVVSTRIGALPDLVEDGVNGYLIAPGDVDTLAARLTALLSDRNRLATMAAESRRRYDNCYSWDSVFGAILGRISARTGFALESLT
jgi:glycosyltransferase involved in cell wall biosynthesis